MTVSVRMEPTRNEHSVIFEVDRQIIPPGTGLPFSDAPSAEGFPLAEALFRVPGVVSVCILGNSVQVTKEENVSWGRVKSRVVETLKSNLNSSS